MIKLGASNIFDSTIIPFEVVDSSFHHTGIRLFVELEVSWSNFRRSAAYIEELFSMWYCRQPAHIEKFYDSQVFYSGFPKSIPCQFEIGVGFTNAMWMKSC